MLTPEGSITHIIGDEEFVRMELIYSEALKNILPLPRVTSLKDGQVRYKRIHIGSDEAIYLETQRIYPYSKENKPNAAFYINLG